VCEPDEREVISLKRFSILVLTIAITLSMVSASVFAAEFSDTNGHWAESVIVKWSDSGVLSGYPDGTFRPNNYITRGEFFKVINTVLKYDTEAANPFSDLKETAWYYSDIVKLVEAGVVKGSDGKVNAEGNITREEAFAILARAYKVPTNPEGITGFIDVATVSSWAAAEVGGMAAAGYVRGNNGAINAKANLTRAEAVQVIENIAGETIGEGETPLAPGTSGAAITPPAVETPAQTQTPDTVYPWLPARPTTPSLGVEVTFEPDPVPENLADAVEVASDGVFEITSAAELAAVPRETFESELSVTLEPPAGIASDVLYEVTITPELGKIPAGILDRDSVTRTVSGADIKAFMSGSKTLEDFYDEAGFSTEIREEIYEALQTLAGSNIEFGLMAMIEAPTGIVDLVELIKLRV
jgi:hypothetical protein